MGNFAKCSGLLASWRGHVATSTCTESVHLTFSLFQSMKTISMFINTCLVELFSLLPSHASFEVATPIHNLWPIKFFTTQRKGGSKNNSCTLSKALRWERGNGPFQCNLHAHSGTIKLQSVSNENITSV